MSSIDDRSRGPGNSTAKRRTPRQARSRRSVEKVLAAALDLLIEDGLGALNTNRIAERAGVNVATLYSYFPDKLSIVKELALRFEAERGDSIEAQAAELVSTDDPGAWFIDIIDRMVDFRLHRTGGVELRRAVISSPELRPLDDASTARATELHIPGLLAHGSDLSVAEARSISRLIAVTVTAVLDDAFAQSPYDQAQVAELKTMIVSYLKSHLT